MIAAICFILLCLASGLLAWIDLRRGILPDWLNLAIAVIGLARAMLLDGWAAAFSAGCEGIAIGAIVFLLRRLYFMFRKFQGLGLGDVKLLASSGVDLNAVDQDGLTALDYTQSRGFMPFMALQTPVFKDEAALLRELGATKLMAKSPSWPVLGPPQGIWEDIWPLGESRVHDPVYKHTD